MKKDEKRSQIRLHRFVLAAVPNLLTTCCRGGVLVDYRGVMRTKKLVQ